MPTSSSRWFPSCNVAGASDSSGSVEVGDVVGLPEDADGLLHRPAGPGEAALVDRPLGAPGSVVRAQAAEGRSGPLLSDRLQPRADVVDLPGHRCSMAPGGCANVTAMAAPLQDLHEYVSFDSPDEHRTWCFDVTFLTSAWQCIYGHGCQGVLTEPAPELHQGCCSYGAHLVDEDDANTVLDRADRLTSAQWQYRRQAVQRGGPIRRNRQGVLVTRLVGEACSFLNRPGFPGGPGCALHRAALEAGERPLDWKPDVCWQLPLRLVEWTGETSGDGTSDLWQWKSH